jgi:hypothetical protein
MQRFRTVSQTAAVVLLLSLLLTACRVTQIPTTAYPGVGSYPGPQTQEPTRAPTNVRPATQPVVPTATPLPSRLATQAATTAPTQAPTPGEVAFTLTIMHTGEVSGETSPCG